MLLDVIFVLFCICLQFFILISVPLIIYIFCHILRALGEEYFNHIYEIIIFPSYCLSSEFLNVFYDPEFICNSKFTISSNKMLVKFGSKLCNMFFVKFIYLSLTVILGHNRHNSKILYRYIINLLNVPELYR